MNIAVCLKQTFDTEAKISLNSSGKIDDANVTRCINPYDEYAVEAGLKLKEKFGGEVTIVSVGGEKTPESMRTALAMGADKGILIKDPVLEQADEWVVAEVLAKAISQIPYDIILSGRIAVDDQSAQVAIRVAEALGALRRTILTRLRKTKPWLPGNRCGTEVTEVSFPLFYSAKLE